jgi:ADP-ribose pyrophosphatase
MQDVELIYQGRIFQVVRKRILGRDGQEHTREIILHPGAVVILPLLDDGRIALIANDRAAVDERLVELPAGTLEPGEDPLAAAHRELAEETGYRAASMELLTSFYASPGILRERMNLFLATGLTSGPNALERDENIDLLIATWEEAIAMARDGRIKDAKTLIGLLWCQTFGGRK